MFFAQKYTNNSGKYPALASKLSLQFHYRAAVFAGARLQIFFVRANGLADLASDVFEREAGLVERFIAIFTEPKELVNFARVAVALQDEPDGASRALRGVRNARGQQKHLAFTDIYGFAFAFLIDDFDLNIAFQLVKKLLAFFPVIVFAAIGATDYHDDKIVVLEVNLFVSDGWFQQIAVFVNPGAKVERFGDGHSEQFVVKTLATNVDRLHENWNTENSCQALSGTGLKESCNLGGFIWARAWLLIGF